MIQRHFISSTKRLIHSSFKSDVNAIRYFSAAAAPKAEVKTATVKESKAGTKVTSGKSSAPTAPKATPTISAKSWAKDGLRKQGEEMRFANEPLHYTVVTKDTITNPGDKVRSLADEILALSNEDRDKMFAFLEARVGFAAREIVKQTIENGGAVGGGDAGAEAVVEAPKEEKTSFNLKLGAVDAKAKIKVIKEVRTITGLGLKEAKELVEKAPVVLKEGLKKEEAEAFIKSLTDAGAEAKME